MTASPHAPTPPDPRPPAPRARSESASKWLALLAFWAAQSALLAPVLILWVWQAGSVDAKDGHPLGDLSKLPEALSVAFEPVSWLIYACVAAGLALLQALIMLPVRKPRPRLHRGVPLALSAAAAALVATVLIAGVVFSVAHVYAEYIHDPNDHSSQSFGDLIVLAFWFSVLACWSLGTILVWAFCSRRLRAGNSWEQTLHALASRLLAGTIIELLAVIPFDVMIRRKTDCYCFAGTFWGLTFGLAAGFIALGPVILLPLLARRRARWFQGRCAACGYDVSSLLAASRDLDRCPECGAGFKPAASPSPTPPSTGH